MGKSVYWYTYSLFLEPLSQACLMEDVTAVPDADQLLHLDFLDADGAHPFLLLGAVADL